MHIDVITLFPEMFQAVTGYGISGRAHDRGLYTLNTWNPRDDADDVHRTVDDRPYGGGPGMVMRVEPLRSTLQRVKALDTEPSPVLYLSPQGRLLDQAEVESLSRRPRLILLAGRYEGIDERLLDLEVDEEWSIGDYVLSGGELAAMVLIDALVRLLPGALGDQQSALEDSFSAGLLDHPHYTRPESIHGLRVPEVLLSGDHQAIARWRSRQSLGRTWLRRPELLTDLPLDPQQQALLDDFIHEHRATTVLQERTHERHYQGPGTGADDPGDS